MPLAAPQTDSWVPNFDALSIASTDANPGLETPVTSEAPSISVAIEDDKSIIAARWREAVRKCRSDVLRMSKADYETVQGFPSFDALVSDLRKRELAHQGKTWMSQCTLRVLPTLMALSTTASVFIGVMVPNTMETALIWGSLHLAMTLSLETRRHWDSFVERLERIRYSLVILNRCAKWCEDEDASSEISTAIFNVFVNLIGFWVEAVKWLRANHAEKMVKDVFLDNTFEKAMMKVETAIKHLTELSTLNGAITGQAELQQRHAELVNLLQTNDERVEFPIRIVPRPAYQGFYGRSDVLRQISTHLDPRRAPDKLRSILIHGTGGVGKTQTVLNYAHSLDNQYDAVFWSRSNTETALKASFTEFATGLKLPGASREVDAGQNLLLFKGWLNTQAARKNGRKWLLIFDNCERISDISPKYIPTTGGSVIFTSRFLTAKLRDSAKIELKKFSPFEGLGLLKTIVWQSEDVSLPSDEVVALEKLLESVDGLPLGIQQIGFLMQSHELSTLEFSAYYERNARRMLKDVDVAEDYDGDQSRAVGTEHILDNVWRMSFQALSPDESALIGMMAFLSPDIIPTALFQLEETAVTVPASVKFCQEEYKLTKAILNLRQAALIGRDGSSLSIHRLIQEALIHNQEQARVQEMFDAATFLANHAFPEQINGRPMHEYWKDCSLFIQHGIALAEAFNTYRVAPIKLQASPELGELLKNCAWYLYEMAEHKTALHVLNIAFELCPDKTTPLYTHLLNTSASCHFELNNLEKEKPITLECLRLREMQFTPGDLAAEEELANALNNSGVSEATYGNLAASLVLYEKAEEIRVRLGEPAIVPLAVTHMCIGRTYFLQGDYPKACERYELARTIFLDKFGKSGHFMGHIQFAQGNLETKRKNMEAARRYYDDAATLLEEATPFHHLLSACYYRIACLLFLQSEMDEALTFLGKAILISDTVGAEGEKARIWRKQSQILLAMDPVGNRARAEKVMLSADLARLSLQGQSSRDLEDSDEAWDSLVCGYYR